MIGPIASRLYPSAKVRNTMKPLIVGEDDIESL